MIRFTAMIIIVFSLVLTGCNGNENEQAFDQDETKYTKLSTSESTGQQISNEVKEMLRNREEITTIHAVNTKELLIVAFEVSHFNRFNLENLKKELKKDLKKEFPKIDMTISTDKKIVLELRKLELDIQSGSISKRNINKKLKEIKKLSEEET